MTTTITTNKHLNIYKWSKKKERENMLLKRNTCAHTYTQSVCTTRLWRSLVSPFFSSRRVFYVCIFVCTTYANAIISLFFFRAFCALYFLSLSLTHTYAWCVHVYACPNFVFVVFFLLLIAHNDGDTRIEGRNLTKKKEECACIHVIVHSIRQNAFEVSLCFFFCFPFSFFFFFKATV
jgi:hypothetical protein